MFGILLSAFNAVLGFVFRSFMVKFVLFFGLFFVTTEFMQIVGTMLPDASALNITLGGVPSAVWYFLDLFNVSAGISVLLTSYVTRFIIRRLPIIG